MYAELDTDSSTTFAFCMESHIENQDIPFAQNRSHNSPAGIEVAFITDDVDAAFKQAVDAGAVTIKDPHQTHWGQTVAVVRDINGVLVELCSPIG